MRFAYDINVFSFAQVDAYIFRVFKVNSVVSIDVK